MGMPIVIEVLGSNPAAHIAAVFDFLTYVDQTFSTYKPTSDIMRLNRGELSFAQANPDVREIFSLADRTKRETDGYFDIRHRGQFDPSGVVKGWAIERAGQMLRAAGYQNFFVEAGGDIVAAGQNALGQAWSVGIRNPFHPGEIVKVLRISDGAVATSGTTERGQHIYNPHQPGQALETIVSLTVVGPSILDADRFATAAFAMGSNGIHFIERLEGFEGYSIDRHGQATLTTNFTRFL